MFKNILKAIGFVFLVGIIYLLFWPIEIEPVTYNPPPNPGLVGVFEANEKLANSELLLEQMGTGPEAVAVLPEDSLLLTGFKNGDIVMFEPNGRGIEIANTNGRPLGMKFDADKKLIIADGEKGLLALDTLGEITLLTNEVNGTKIFYADDLDITSNGTIYFTDATQRNHDVMKEVWELQPTGRLLSYHPQTKETKVEMEGLRFANGVAIGPNEDYLLVTETFGMRVHKYWLKGEKQGQSEVWQNELPGFPDNITYNGKGIFWLALPDQRVPDLDAIMPRPFLRKILYRLPESMRSAKPPAPHGMILGIDLEGNIVYNFQTTNGKVHAITSCLEYNDTLYLGSLRMQAIAKIAIDDQ